MDPVTAGLLLATEVVKLAGKIYEDTPSEIKKAQAERWEKFLARFEKMLDPDDGKG